MSNEEKRRDLLNLKQVAEMLGVEKRQVILWRREAGLPYFQLLHRKKRFYGQRGVERWAERRGLDLHPISVPFQVPKEEMSVWQHLDSVDKDD